ncbi:MAG: RecX family transcriptional regulator [Chloroflexi bacterium AL-W]|nr:RecX family transcriptional regulator [Chloroflexi bacterium AL-N1]NOK68626.1 RecX family transcriptional regulator [Chloroflexi bacterium AL-N10]NOK76112.1 RecX family transcriptional regulator [Chloroflexi bacterium AL-N5]NOK82585.1 RecX family transcriptional regulator [Chloroflexi bacterium AL-W]NOK93383.1 RecX family transcriptional regulator [Chloroflexi bacterium AL-N15]
MCSLYAYTTIVIYQNCDYTMPVGTITSLHAQINDSQRISVFIDGVFALGISLTTLTREGLYVGKVLSEADYQRLEQTETTEKSLYVALRLLSARPRSTAEIRERLQRKGFTATSIEQTVERLRELDLLDDTAFARLWIENRQTHRPRGVNALRDELRRKGVHRDIVEATLQDDQLIGDETEQAITLARSIVHKYSDSPNRTTFARRMGGYLQRRGFNFDIVHSVIDQLWQEIQHQQEHTQDNDM